MNTETLTQQQLQMLCQYFQLGDILTHPTELLGGLLHKSWLVDSSTGKFVIKQLNPDIIDKPLIKNRYQITEKIAELLKQKISLVTALQVNNDPLLTLTDKTFMVFPYVHGKLIDQNAINNFYLQQISKALSLIHKADIKLNNVPPVETFVLDLSKLENSFMHLQRILPQLTSILVEAKKLIAMTYSQYEKWVPLLQNNLIISHRDLDPKNVLWSKDGQYYLIDWESAGLINKTKDFIVTALYWSMNIDYIIDFSKLEIFTKNYFKDSKNINLNEIEAGLYGIVADRLGWLEFNINRVLMHSKNSPEFNLGVTEIKKTLTELPLLIQQFTRVKKVIFQITKKIKS